MRRDAAPQFGQNAIHADTFDGSMVAFALMCNKIPTPVFPAAHFEPSAMDQFVQVLRAADGDPKSRPDKIRLKKAPDGSELKGAMRAQRDAVVLILPGAVAHSIPSDIRLHEESSVDSRGEPLANQEDNRWFCRVSIEIIAGGVSQGGATDGGAWAQWQRPWPPMLRQQVSLLTAHHVWGDPEFAERAKVLA